jgi:hypothetical protein
MAESVFNLRSLECAFVERAFYAGPLLKQAAVNGLPLHSSKKYSNLFYHVTYLIRT